MPTSIPLEKNRKRNYGDGNVDDDDDDGKNESFSVRCKTAQHEIVWYVNEQ